MPRNPQVPYPQRLFRYLVEISESWNHRFENPDSVTVGQLIDEFDRVVSNDLRRHFPQRADEYIKQFHVGALEAQPKIVIINEVNRCHFGIRNPENKQLFVYMDYPDGNWRDDCQWKDVKIQPLWRLQPPDIMRSYIIYWRDADKVTRSTPYTG